MKKVLFILLLCLLFISCINEARQGADEKLQKESERVLKEATNQMGLPNIVNFQQKKLMKMIYELCDKQDLICHAYIYSQYQAKLIYIGKCIGYGIPFSAQYSNPEKYFNDPNGYRSPSLKMPQAEPNGLFMPTSSAATWLIMVNPETGDPEPVYFEPEIIISPFKLDIG